jgi:hypothetical protein
MLVPVIYVSSEGNIEEFFAKLRKLWIAHLQAEACPLRNLVGTKCLGKSFISQTSSPPALSCSPCMAQAKTISP